MEVRPLKRRLLLSNIVFTVLGLATIYTIHFLLTDMFIPHERLSAEFTDGMILRSDGKGRYVDGFGAVRIDVSGGGLVMDIASSPTAKYVESSRFVFIGFGEATWLNSDFEEVNPLLPSDRYRIYLAVTVLGGDRPVEPQEMELGFRYDPCVGFMVYNADTGELMYSVIRSPKREFGAFYSYVLDLREPIIPPKLYIDGYVYFTRVGETVWVLEGDSWFLALRIPSESEEWRFPRFYVRISFRVTITYTHV